MNSISVRIKRLREAGGLTQSQLGANLGVTSVAISRWEGGLNLPKASRLLQLADFFNVNADWLKTGIQKVGQRQFVDIPFYRNVSVSAGTGCFCSEEYLDGMVSINKESLSKASSLKNLACISVSGVSMEPVIRDGGIVAIDLGSTNIHDGSVYAIYQNGELRLKRLFNMPLGLKIVSYNTEFSDEFYDHNTLSLDGTFKIVGRAVWYSSSF